MLRRVGANHQGESGKPVELVTLDHGAVAVDQGDAALVLPQRQGLAFLDLQINGVGQTARDHHRFDPTQGLHPLTRLVHVNRQNRHAAGDIQRGDQIVAGGNLAAAHQHLAHLEPGIGRRIQHAGLGARHLPAPPARLNRRPNRGAAATGECHGRDRDRNAPPLKSAHRPPALIFCAFALGAEGDQSHWALSTSQSTNCGNAMPLWAACSGTSDRRVMPGWVLTSSITSSSASSS